MPLQLIYTSAPRLLQAGRTGFGTVAAHPGIPSWLVAEIERASQFSRVPGLDAARIVVRHMVFGEGDRVHHVLSRIQDAGADYTGRTNHIAHHFIFTAAEAAKATAHGVTPVDALAFLESHKLWQTSWDGEPRPLGDDTILPVDSIPQTITLPAETYWGALVPGRPECAAILAPGKTSEACWIVYPHGWSDAIVYAMGESLALHSNPWGVSFANNLQPTDNEQQIAWRGIPADSPLLPKAQSSVRPCIDLTNPGALPIQPVPEFVEEARTGSKPLPKPRAAAPSATSVRPDSGDRPAQVIALLSKTNERPRRNPYAFPLAVMVAILVLLLAVGGGIWGYDLYSKNKAISEELAGLRAEIMELVSPIHNVPDLSIFENPGELATLLEFLKEVSNEDTARAEESLTKIKGISSEWNDWRSVCNNLLESKKGQMEKKTLADLYAKASQGDALDDEQWNQFQTLAKKLHPEDEKWGNAVKAVSFLKNPGSDGVSFWMQNRGMPETKDNSLNLNDLVFKKINQIKVDEYNNNIADISDENKFREGLAKLLNDWPQDSEQRKFLEGILAPEVVTNSKQPKTSRTDEFNKNGLKLPNYMIKSPKEISNHKQNDQSGNSYFVEQPRIYIIADNLPTDLYPNSPEKWRPLTSDQVTWDQLSSNNSSLSREENSPTHFTFKDTQSKGFYVFVKNERGEVDPKFYVVDRKSFSNSIIDFNEICSIPRNQLSLEDKFMDFLNRLFKSKSYKYNVKWSLKYSDDLFKDLNQKIQEIKKELYTGDITKIIERAAALKEDEKAQKTTSLKNEEKKKTELELELSNFRTDDWKDLRKKVQKEINSSNVKNNDSFYNSFSNTNTETLEGFKKVFSDSQKKKELIDSISKMDKEITKDFFIEENNWDESKFQEQFDVKAKEILDKKLEHVEKNIKQLKEEILIMERGLSNLRDKKTDQKATLNFYLEETDTEPFLTTEVTIPFASEKPTDASTPTTPPAL